MIEIWQPIPGYEDSYEISDLGQIRSCGRFIAAKLGSRRWQAERILKPRRTRDGYRTVALYAGMRRHDWRVHRLVLLAFVGGPPINAEACHANGDPEDNRLANLRWDTRSANIFDQVKHGRHQAARKTHCKQGHPLIEPNLYHYGNVRACKTCRLETSRIRYLERKNQRAQ